MPIEFVFLDLGNVIVSFDVQHAIAQACDLSGGNPIIIEDFLRDSELQDAAERGNLSWDDFHKEFCRRTNTLVDSNKLAVAISNIFSLNIHMLPLIARLNRCDCGLGILSNTCSPHWDYLTKTKRLGILNQGFDTVVLSHEVGCRKPEMTIFEIATEAAGVPAEKIFFADDLVDNVTGAQKFGWHAEVFHSAHILADTLTHFGLPCNV